MADNNVYEWRSNESYVTELHWPFVRNKYLGGFLCVDGTVAPSNVNPNFPWSYLPSAYQCRCMRKHFIPFTFNRTNCYFKTRDIISGFVFVRKYFFFQIICLDLFIFCFPFPLFYGLPLSNCWIKGLQLFSTYFVKSDKK